MSLEWEPDVLVVGSDLVMNEAAVKWLLAEIDDVLDVDDVGLYEFIWLLRGKYPSMGMSEAEWYAERALASLLERADVRLVWQKWPQRQLVDVVAAAGRRTELWRDPVAGDPYPAVARVVSPV